MECYSVKELRDKLVEHVLGLGINSKFKENPAFSSVISQIDNLIAQMNMFEASEKVTADEENNRITFEWRSQTGEKYSMIISCPKPETIEAIKVEEKTAFIGKNGKLIKEKNVIENIATLDKYGGINLISNSSTIDNVDCQIGKCNNTTSSERKYYISKGIMTEREYKGFSTAELSVDLDKAKIDEMLIIPRNAFIIGSPWHNKYDSRTLLVRDKLDTARIASEDRTKGIEYRAITPLDQEHGLRNMNLSGGNDPYPQDIEIFPLSQEEIETMIENENNSKVEEGLRELAKGRTTYSYDSSKDEKFYYKNDSLTKGKTK